MWIMLFSIATVAAICLSAAAIMVQTIGQEVPRRGWSRPGK